jgi:hypothetical protein
VPTAGANPFVGIVESVRPDTILVRTSVENLSAFPLDQVTRLELSRGTSRPTWSLAAHTAVSGRRCRQCDGAGRRTGDLGHGRRRYAVLGVGALGVANAAEAERAGVYRGLLWWGAAMVVTAPIVTWLVLILPIS